VSQRPGLKRARRISIVLAIAGLVLVALAGSASASLHLSGTGVVVGGLEPCSALGVSNGPRYAAGKVTVFRGEITWTNAGTGTTLAVFPTTVVTHQDVGANRIYWFLLGRGDYVLLGQYATGGATIRPWVETRVNAGTIAHVDVPNMCI
jgi:hypothetical protein